MNFAPADRAPSNGDALDFARAALGLLLAQPAPAFALAACIPWRSPSDFFALACLLTVFSLFQTVPLTLFCGLPVALTFHRLGWRGWPPYAIAGAVIGNIPAYGYFRPDLDWIAFWSLMGAISASAYWLAAYGRQRAWSLCGGLLAFAIAVRVVLELAV
ncbi:MAG: hypothetical protein QNJ67_21275 [Kiloniellales bacterium]|nr:hypothetical protein [Kiloniellales bacterium]